MITLENTPLEANRQADIRTLFGRDEFKNLERVILSKLTEHSVKATESAMQMGQFPTMLEAAENDLKKAIRYQTALEVLKEVREYKEFVITTTKVNPA